eukprot:ANDGO_06351.mRNA.1 putative Rho GTPase-activating protein CG5521
MFLSWIHNVKLLEEDKTKGMLMIYPLPVRRTLVSQIVSFVRNDVRSSAVFTTKAQMDWSFECLGQAFALPIDDSDVIQNAVDIYRSWIQNAAMRPPAFLESSHAQIFFQDMFKHFSLMFETRGCSGPVLERHVQLCTQILDLFIWIGRERPRMLTADSWQVLLHVVLGVTDATLRAHKGVHELIPQLFRVLLELWMRSGLQTIGIWEKLRSFYTQYCDHTVPVAQWVAVCNHLNRRVIRVLYGPYAFDERLFPAGNSSMDVDMYDDDTIIFLWNRLLQILGNPSKIRNADVFLQAISGIASMCDVFCNIGTFEPEVAKGESSPVLPHPPHTNTVLQIFGSWLFEAALLSKEEHRQGRAVAMGCLCRLFCRNTGGSVDPQYLARFYAVLRIGITKHDVLSQEAILFHGQSLFAMEFPGSRMLVPFYLGFLEVVLKTPATFRAEHRKAAITILGSFISVPNHFLVSEEGMIRRNEDAIAVGSLYMTVKPRLRDLLLDCIRSESDPLCLQMLLWCLVLFAYDESSRGFSAMVDTIVGSITEPLCSPGRWPYDVCVTAFKALSSLSFIPSDPRVLPSLKFPTLAISSLCTLTDHFLSSIVAANRVASDAEQTVIEESFYAIVDWTVAYPQRLTTGSDVASQMFRCIDVALMGFQYGQKTESNLSEVSTPPATTEKDKERDRKTLSPNQTDSRKSSKAAPKPPSACPIAQFPRRIQEAALFLYFSILNTVAHFPTTAGASRMSSLVDDDMSPEDDAAAIGVSKGKPNTEFFLMNNNSVVSVVERNPSVVDPEACVQDSSVQSTIMVRNMTGRYSWNFSIVRGEKQQLTGSTEEIFIASQDKAILSDLQADLQLELEAQQARASAAVLSMKSSASPVYMDRLRADLASLAEDDASNQVVRSYSTGPLDPSKWDLLDHTVTELSRRMSRSDVRQRKVSTVSRDEPPLSTVLRKEFSAAVADDLANPRGPMDPWSSSSCVALPFEELAPSNYASRINYSRLALCHLGLTDRSFRSDFLRLDTSQKNTFRSLRMLDRTAERECHKIGIIYVGHGQEAQHEILENDSGSDAYNDFLRSLGWLVDVSRHDGFLGGLDMSTGQFSPYYADHKCEVAFHAPTMMPTKEGDKQQIAKKRHVGNDHVHIIYSDHYHDYRVKTIRSQFNFVHIVVYPLPSGLYRIRVYTKEGIGLQHIGPLLNNMVCSKAVLGELVRQTAVHATRLVRFMQSGYKRPFPTRKDLLEELFVRVMDLPEEKYYGSLFAREPGQISDWRVVVGEALSLPPLLEFPISVAISNGSNTKGTSQFTKMGRDASSAFAVSTNEEQAMANEDDEPFEAREVEMGFVNPSFQDALNEA